MHHQELEARTAVVQRVTLMYLGNQNHSLFPQGHTWVLYIFSRCLISGDLKSGSWKVRGEGLRKLPSMGTHVLASPAPPPCRWKEAAASDDLFTACSNAPLRWSLSLHFTPGNQVMWVRPSLEPGGSELP